MLNNMKIGKRLLASFILIVFIAGTAGIVSVFMTRSIDKNYSSALVSYGFAQGDIGRVMLSLADDRRCVRDIICLTERGHIERAKAENEENNRIYDQFAKKVKTELQSSEAESLFQQASLAMEQYRAKRDQVLRLGESGDVQQLCRAQAMMAEEMDTLYAEVYDAWAAILENKTKGGDRISGELTGKTNRTTAADLTLISAAMGVAAALGILISRDISKRITQVVYAAEEIAAGNLDVEIRVKGQDEIGILAKTFRAMAENLRVVIGDAGYRLSEIGAGNLHAQTEHEKRYVGQFEHILFAIKQIEDELSATLAQINQAADQVAIGSGQVSGSAQTLSQGAADQASSIEELAAAITEISAQVEHNAENSKTAYEMSERASREVAEGSAKMEEMNRAMQDINAKSAEIGKIIKTIEDIAFQTNILALNAAVEAARAGETGKGFAVVADEVRSLAGKSADAAKSTTQLIEQSIAAVENGTRISGEAAQAMEHVVAGAEGVNRLVDQVSAETKQQALSISQVTLGIDQISRVVQTNSATAEESAAASQELSGQAQVLKSLVHKFHLKENFCGRMGKAKQPAIF